MEMIIRMLGHTQWANQRLLAELTVPSIVNPQVKRIMTHIVQSEWVWLTRLTGNDSSHIKLWPERDLNECASIAELNSARYQEVLESIQDGDLDRIIMYRNQTGKQYHTSVMDILTHVTMHSHYHRGQINVLLRADGKEPMNVDMITYVRELAGQ